MCALRVLFSVFSFVVLSSLIGCSENPTSVSLDDPVTITPNNGLLKIAAMSPIGDTVANRIIAAGVQTTFGIKGPQAKIDSILSITYYFKGVAYSVTGAGNGEYKYSIADTGKQVVRAVATMKNLTAREILDTFVIVLPNYIPLTKNVFVFLGSTVASPGVWQVSIGQDVDRCPGNTSFFAGMDNWNSPIGVNSSTPKNSAGTYYITKKNLVSGVFYTWNGGTLWEGLNATTTQWYGATVLATDRYFKANFQGRTLGVCVGFMGYNGYLYPVDSIPVDSGRTSISPAIDSIPGTYGDAGINGKIRFTDLKHFSGLDSVIIYARIDSIGCSGNSVVAVTNMTTSNVVMTVLPTNSRWASAVIAVADMPIEGLKWNISRGTCIQDATGSKYAYSGIAPFTYWGKWFIYQQSLAKKSAITTTECMQTVN